MAGIMSRREEKKQNSRKAITQAAVRLFSEKGYRETSIADIMREADLGIGTFYNYFHSKEDVLKSLLSEIIVEIEQKYERLAKKRQLPAAILTELCSLTAELLDRNRFVLPLFLSAAEKSGVKTHASHKTPNFGFQRIFCKVLEHGQAVGEFRQDIPAAVMTEIFHSVFQAAAFSSLDMDFLSNVKYKFKIILDGICKKTVNGVDRSGGSC